RLESQPGWYVGGWDGEAGVGAWQLLAQDVSVPEGATVRLAFEGRLRGARVDPGQFDNAHVAVRLQDARGSQQLVARPVLGEAWAPGELVLRVPRGRLQVHLFLSKTGVLELRRLALEVLDPAQSLDVLLRHMDLYYAHFPAPGGLDWDAHVARLRPRAEGARDDEAAWLALLRDLLAPLGDLHVTLRDRQGGLHPTVTAQPTPNVDATRLWAVLGEPRRVGSVGLVALPAEGVGYVAVTSLMGSEAEHRALQEAWEGLLASRRGLLVDLRGCVGGNEQHAWRLAARLVERPLTYARRRVRSGPGRDGFGPWQDAVLRPAGGAPFTGPVVVLVGPGCVSSGEALAKMLRERPGTLLVGQPTRGASGNPAPVALPNGLEVSFSRWQDTLADGTPTEGRGVAPHEVVDPRGPGDPTLARGLERLRERLASEPPGR
ncbi:MAG: S41 family peptidase, partial [Planctomycetia bacterium]